jgi:hypothetical protein
MATLNVHRVPVLHDNYVWLAHEVTSGVTMFIDPSVVEPASTRDHRSRGGGVD